MQCTHAIEQICPARDAIITIPEHDPTSHNITTNTCGDFVLVAKIATSICGDLDLWQKLPQKSPQGAKITTYAISQ